MPDHKRLMKLIDDFLGYVSLDTDCKKCPCYKTDYCQIFNNELEDWECKDGIYEWLMNN